MGKSDRLDAQLAQVLGHASSNEGIFTAEAARTAGLSRSAVGRLVSAGLLERVAPGHLRGAHLPWTLEARHRQAIILTGRGAALGARSALNRWGLGDRPQRIEVLVPWGGGGTRGGHRLVQSKDIGSIDTVRHRGMETSTPTRAVIDAARWLRPLELQQVISAGVERNLITIKSLHLRHCELARRGRPGTRALRTSLAMFSEGVMPASTFERDFERLVARFGFPTPVRQMRVVADQQVYFLDHAWPDLGVWSECDSMLAHGSAEALRKDLERQNRITTATGMEPLRFTYFDVHERPEYVAEILDRRLPRSR